MSTSVPPLYPKSLTHLTNIYVSGNILGAKDIVITRQRSFHLLWYVHCSNRRQKILKIFFKIRKIIGNNKCYAENSNRSYDTM